MNRAGLSLAGAVRKRVYAGFYWATGRSDLLPGVAELESLYRAPRESLDAVVRRNLFGLLSHALGTVPYYRTAGRDLAGRLSEAKAVSVLHEMPVLTKEIIRKEGPNLLSEKPGRKVQWNTSGGSTGEPVRLLQDERMRRQATANKILFMKWLGYEVGEPHLLIWGVPQQTFNRKIGLREWTYRKVHNQVYLNCYTTSDDLLRRWLECINDMRPSIIEAYVDSICDLAQLILAAKHQVAAPKGIITSAGVLSSEARCLLQQAFRCPVLNRYGSREVSDIACSCLSAHHLHVSEAQYYVEVVDDNYQPCDPGVEGMVLVTLLTNLTMPLIRYRIEDRAVWASGPCECGRTTRRLAAVTGRQNDFLVAADGTRVNGTALTTLLYAVQGIRRFQYRQARREHVILTVEPLDGAAHNVLSQNLREPMENLRGLLKGTQVELVFASQITPSKSGKYRYVLNETMQA